MPEHIITPIPEEPRTATLGQLAPLTLQRLDPFRRLWRAQDSQPAQSRRVLAEYSLAGSVQWSVPDAYIDPDGGAQNYPIETSGGSPAWREVGRYRGRLTAGCMLESHVMYCPAGLVQRQVGGSYESAGAWAEYRVAVTWSREGTVTGPHYWTLSMPGSPLGPYGGAEPSVQGADWDDLEERLLETIRPPDVDDDLDLAADMSEWPEVDITLEVRGGERIVHATVYEVPDRHVQRHDDSGPQTVHGAPSADVPFPASAREDAPDVGAYENHRHGTVRTMQVAQRQGERLGPRVMSWSAHVHAESYTGNRYLEVAPSADFVEAFDPNIEGWDPEHPGWVVACSTAKLHRLHGVAARGRLAVVPVTVWVDASRADTGVGDAVVRLQSGQYEWLDVTFDATVGRRTIRTYGYLESQVHGDHAAANLVLLAQVTGAPLRIYGVSVEFGHF